MAERLKSERLAYADEDQGRDALTEILSIAVQLGIEQGRRIFRTSSEMKKLKLDFLLATMKQPPMPETDARQP